MKKQIFSILPQKESISRITKNKIFLNLVLTMILFLFLFSNIIWMSNGKYSTHAIFEVLKNPTQDMYSGSKRVGISPDQFRELSESSWAVIATLVASVGLALSGLITQSLTKNPLADASTLGFMQAGIFMLLIALSVGWVSYYVKFLFVIVGVAVAAILLVTIITISKRKVSATKIILAGLAIGIIFKTFSFLIRHGDKTIGSVSFNYTLGGAESVNKSIGNDQWLTLYISAALISAALIIFILIAKALTLIELGDENAKHLGVKVKTVKVVSILIMIITIPSAVILVGNLAFVGLFAAHLSRYLFKTRDYRVIFVPSILIGPVLGLFGFFLSNWLPQVNSGLWMTFIGAPFIIYAGIRGLK